MVKKISSKRIIKLVLAAAAVIVVSLAFAMSASAKTYNKIVYDVPRISQRPYTGDCAIASMATVEAYCYGLPAGDYNSTAYQAIYAANGYQISAMWPQLGYDTIEYFDRELAYDTLKTGYPVIVHRTSSHYSVVYGYDGSTTSLELSGFLVVDVDDSYNSTTAYRRLDSWVGGYSLDRMVIRRNGIAIQSQGLKITSNHPAEYHIKGEKFTPYGTVASGNTLTNVSVSIKSAAGNIIQPFNVNPQSTSYRLSNVSKIDVSSLAVGSYTYSVSAKDSSGAVKTYDFPFKVVMDAYIPPEPQEPEIKKVNYKVVVNADPSLNMRMSAKIDSTWIISIPDGEALDITAECNGWGMTTYKGHTGWVSLEYTDKYVEPPIVEPPVVEPVEPVIINTRYGRVTAGTSIKSTAFYFATNVVSVPKNAIVKVLSTEGTWFKVAYGKKEGYLPSSLCVDGIFDVDGNAKINSADALAALEHSIGKKTLGSTAVQAADSNGDGKVNSVDALAILQVSTGIKTY